MGIEGLDGMDEAALEADLARGGRFVAHQFCISIVIMTFKRTTRVRYIPAGRSAFGHAIGPSLLTLLLGWWGIPWGPIYTLQVLFNNLRGGLDVTDAVLASAEGAEAAA